MRVLYAFQIQNRILVGEIHDQVRGAANSRRLKVTSSTVYDVAEAIQVFNSENFTHLVVQDSLPQDRYSPPCPGCGIGLAENLWRIRKDLQLLMVSSRTNQNWSTSDSRRMIAMGMVPYDNSADGLSQIANAIVESQPPRPVIDIIIDLSHGDREYGYHITSSDPMVRPREGKLELPPYALDGLRRLSEQLENCENKTWPADLKALRGTLYDSLIERHTSFRDALAELLCNGEDQIRSRVCFRIDTQKYDVAFEAIKHPNTDDFWMLHAPVVRSFKGVAPKPVRPVFDGRNNRVDHCLIILSDAHGPCAFSDRSNKNGHLEDYPHLKLAREECKLLRDRLTKETSEKNGSGMVGAVDMVGYDEKLTRSGLVKKLQEQRWDLIHYIGHTEFVGNEGYLILPNESDEEQSEPLPIEDVAPSMREAPFVYLSSCQGAKPAFVRRLAEQRVPCMLGFRTNVPDYLALDHATFFYDRLFLSSSIEKAFFETRQHFHTKYSSERLWACSSLVMQHAH